MTAWPALQVAVTPRRDEFMPGLMLRDDEKNDFPPGGTASIVRRHDASTSQLGKSSLGILGTLFDREGLASLNGLEPGAVTALTWRAELERVFGPGVAASRLGLKRRLSICPACVRPPLRLIRRQTALPLMHGCEVHGIWLRTACVCGAPIEPFGRVVDRRDPEGRLIAPFHCQSCGRPWESLPRQPLGPRDELRQRRVAHAYQVVLGRGGPDVIENARRVLALDEGGRWDHGWCLSDDAALAERAMEARHVKSISAVVANLVLREIPPERVLERPREGPHPDLLCRNAECPTYGTSGAIRVSSERSNGTESYCAECGSRFLGERTILSYDLGNASGDLSRLTVLHAQARLADYAARLAEAATFLAYTDRSAEVDHVFHAAGVPQASHLRARRLGLVGLVARRLGRPVRGQNSSDRRDRHPDLVADGFADRWSFPRFAVAALPTEAGPPARRDRHASEAAERAGRHPRPESTGSRR